MVPHHPLPSPPQTLRGHLCCALPRFMASVGQNRVVAVQTNVMVMRVASAVAIMVSALGACGPGPVTSHLGHVRVGSHANWPTYHADARRSGSVAELPAAGRLAIGWSRRLNGAVYGQPLVIGDTVIAGTEGDTVYGLSLASGRVRWARHVAGALPLRSQPCGNIDPLGITSTPVFYRGLVYALAQDGRYKHVLVGLDPASGRVRYRRAVASPDHRPVLDQQRAAPPACKCLCYHAIGRHLGDDHAISGSVFVS